MLDRLSRGEAPEYVEAAARVFDPNTITIGFARRVAAYKRLYLRGANLRIALAVGHDSDAKLVSPASHPSATAAGQPDFFQVARQRFAGRVPEP